MHFTVLEKKMDFSSWYDQKKNFKVLRTLLSNESALAQLDYCLLYSYNRKVFQDLIQALLHWKRFKL